MHNIKTNFDKYLHILTELATQTPFLPPSSLRPGPKIKFTDLEVLALCLVSEYMGIDSEAKLFVFLKSNYSSDFPNLLSRRRYNDRRADLLEVFKGIQEVVAAKFEAPENIYVVDSTPLRVCRVGRWTRNKMGKGNISETPAVGHCAAQQEKYFGFKGHMTTTSEGIIKDITFTKANVDDRDYLRLNDFKQKFKNCTIVGDKGYIDDELKSHLLNRYHIDLQHPYRKNQKNKPILPKNLAKTRRIIETVFSNLKEAFNTRRNFAKNFRHFKSRILSKICSMTLMQYINKFIIGNPVNQVTYALNNYTI